MLSCWEYEFLSTIIVAPCWLYAYYYLFPAFMCVFAHRCHMMQNRMLLFSSLQIDAAVKEDAEQSFL